MSAPPQILADLRARLAVMRDHKAPHEKITELEALIKRLENTNAPSRPN